MRVWKMKINNKMEINNKMKMNKKIKSDLYAIINNSLKDDAINLTQLLFFNDRLYSFFHVLYCI